MYQQTILALAIEIVGEGEAGIYTPGRAWQAEVAGRLIDRLGLALGEFKP